MPTGPNRIGEPIDRKFAIKAVCREHTHGYDENHAVLFAAKDVTLPNILRFAIAECERVGAAERQIEGYRLLLARVERYQAAHPELVKVPDVDAGAAGDIIVAPNLDAA